MVFIVHLSEFLCDRFALAIYTMYSWHMQVEVHKGLCTEKQNNYLAIV